MTHVCTGIQNEHIIDSIKNRIRNSNFESKNHLNDDSNSNLNLHALLIAEISYQYGIKQLFEHIKMAHYDSGAPGEVIGIDSNGQYIVRIKSITKQFRFKLESKDCVKVTPSWNIKGVRHQKLGRSSASISLTQLG